MVVSYQLTFLFSAYLKSSFRLRHWFSMYHSCAWIKGKYMWNTSSSVCFCLRDVCVCLSETGVFFLCTSKLWWMKLWGPWALTIAWHHVELANFWLFWEFYLTSQFTLHFCPTWFCVWIHCFSIAPEIFFQLTCILQTLLWVCLVCVSKCWSWWCVTAQAMIAPATRTIPVLKMRKLRVREVLCISKGRYRKR